MAFREGRGFTQRAHSTDEESVPSGSKEAASHSRLHRAGRLCARYLICAVGVVINSFGIALITVSALGTSPVSGIPYVASLAVPNVSFGLWTFAWNMLMIIGQIVLLRRDFTPVNYLQIFVNVLFSAALDISVSLLFWIDTSFLPVQLICVFLGCAILGFGIAVEVAPDVLVVPGEGIVRAIARVTKIRFGTVKICFDVSVVIIALVMSFAFFGGVRGLGVGTIISALIVGWFVNVYDAHVPFLKSIRRLARDE